MTLEMREAGLNLMQYKAKFSVPFHSRLNTEIFHSVFRLPVSTSDFVVSIVEPLPPILQLAFGLHIC